MVDLATLPAKHAKQLWAILPTASLPLKGAPGVAAPVGFTVWAAANAAGALPLLPGRAQLGARGLQQLPAWCAACLEHTAHAFACRCSRGHGLAHLQPRAAAPHPPSSLHPATLPATTVQM